MSANFTENSIDEHLRTLKWIKAGKTSGKLGIEHVVTLCLYADFCHLIPLLFFCVKVLAFIIILMPLLPASSFLIVSRVLHMFCWKQKLKVQMLCNLQVNAYNGQKVLCNNGKDELGNLL